MALWPGSLGIAGILLCVAAFVAPAGTASAQPKSAIDEARELAREGYKALDEESYGRALEKGTQAETLYHAPTHLLLIGNAQAGLGKLADALDTFEKLAAEPLPPGAPGAFVASQETAKKRVKELIARVPSVLVSVQTAEPVAAKIAIDNKPVDFSAGVALRLNPGEHEITATAEGYESAKVSVKLPEKGGVVRVQINLEKPRAAPTATATASTSADVTASPTATAAATTAPTATAENSRVPTYVAFGVGGAAVIVGAIAGGVSASMTSELKAACPDNLCPTSERDRLNSANALAHASTGAFVFGGVAAATGLLLLLLRKGPEPAAKTATPIALEPWIGAGGVGFRGRF
ncbi:MAG: PEGA domain-containing protein [Polyangiaceae bacterium]|nr:PEGA domain-containing protein [Polyangiaceae bacterium]